MHNCGCTEQITVPDPCCCEPAVAPLVPSNCRAPVQMSEIAPLVWVYGLDAENCRKYQAVANVLGLIACDGSPVNASTPIVTCALFSSQLCTVLAALPSAGVAGPTTQLVGKNCQTYTLPPAAGTITVTDTATVDLTLAGNILSADVEVSSVAGNQIEVVLDGLYVPAPVTQNIVGTDCLEVLSVEGTLVLSPIISANSCNAISCTEDGLLVLESTSAGSMTTEVVQLDQPVLQGTVLDLPLVTLDITNPSTCRSAILSVMLQTPAICTSGVNPVQTRFDLLLQRSLAPVYSEAEFILTSTSFNAANDSDASYDRGWVYTVPPAFTGTVTARVRVTQIAGDQSNVNVISPVLRYHLSTI